MTDATRPVVAYSPKVSFSSPSGASRASRVRDADCTVPTWEEMMRPQIQKTSVVWTAMSTSPATMITTSEPMMTRRGPMRSSRPDMSQAPSIATALAAKPK